MRKHQEVIQAWLDGKDIQFKNFHGGWSIMDPEALINPLECHDLEWRVSPETKKVDYQALIDSGLLVKLHDGDESSTYFIGSLNSVSDLGFYVDNREIHWKEIDFTWSHKHVVSRGTHDELCQAGFSVVCFDTYRDSFNNEHMIIVLEGVREGYIL